MRLLSSCFFDSDGIVHILCVSQARPLNQQRLLQEAMVAGNGEQLSVGMGHERRMSHDLATRDGVTIRWDG
jgi:hypothetical protein